MTDDKIDDKKFVQLHGKVTEISFSNKYRLEHVFETTITGILGIDYFSLMIVDENNILSCYSTFPSLEFYLIKSGLWVHDGIFQLKNHIHGTFVFWDALYTENFKEILLAQKQRKFGFNFGCFVMKKINKIFVIYSFATRTTHNREAYKNSISYLTRMGNFFFEEMEDIYLPYITYTSQMPKSLLKKVPSHLTLVINNDENVR